MQIRDITPQDLKAKLAGGNPPHLLDVREPSEREVCNIGGQHIPMKQIAAQVSEIPKDQDVVVYCKGGGRSAMVVDELQKKGFTNLYNLKGGIFGWIDQIDPSLKKY